MKNVLKRKLSRLVVISFLLLIAMTSCVLAQSARNGSGSGTDTVTSASMPEPDKSAGENVKGKKMRIRGTVVIYGNEPHTYAGIRAEDGKKVYAIYPVDAERKLRTLQGHSVLFKVILLDKPAGEGSLYLKDGTVRPMSWKIVD